MTTRKADSLIESTIETLDNGLDNARPIDGVSLIRNWLAVVQKEEAMQGMVDELQALLDQLSEEKPDARKVALLVKKLGDETARMAKKADESYQSTLKDLAYSLKDFAKELK